MLIKTYSRKSIFSWDYKVEKCPCRRIWNAEDMKKLVQIGLVGPASHIRVHRPRTLHFLWWKFDYSYNHHYMVVSATTESLTIIHYAPKKISRILLFQGVAEIKEETVKIENNTDTLDFKSGVYLIVKEKYPKTLRQRSYCVKKARRRLGERQYSVFHNNCDSFVSWTLRGQSISIQAMEATGLLLFIGLLARTSIRIYRFVKSVIDWVNDVIDSYG